MPTRPQSIFSPGGQSPIEMNINLGYGAHKASHKEVSINPEVHAEHILSGAVPAINETTIRMDWPGEGGPHFSGHPASTPQPNCGGGFGNGAPCPAGGAGGNGAGNGNGGGGFPPPPAIVTQVVTVAVPVAALGSGGGSGSGAGPGTCGSGSGMGSGMGSGAGAGSGAGKYGSGSGMGSGAGAGPVAYAPPPMASPPPHPLPPPPPPMYAAPAPPPTCALNVIKDATFSTASPQATSFVTVTIGVPSSQKLQLGSGSGEYGGGPALPLPARGGPSAAPEGGGPGVAPGNGVPGVGPRGAPGGTPGTGPDPGTGPGDGSGVAPGNGSPGSEPGTAPAPAQVTTALAPRRRPSFLLLTAILLAALISLLPRLVFKDSASPVPSHSDLEAAFFGPLIRTETGLFRFQG